MENKKKTFIVGFIVVSVIFLVFLSTLLTRYKHSREYTTQKENIERVDVTLDYIPQIDWADMALFFNISNMRVQTKRTQSPLLGAVKIPTIITFDIEAKEALNHPLFLAHFLDSKGRDVLRSKPVQMEPVKEEVISTQWKPGNIGTAHFVIDKDKISHVQTIIIKRRIKD